ncbi:amidohydrolase family protein [Mycobacterium sp. NPDC049093]
MAGRRIDVHNHYMGQPIYGYLRNSGFLPGNFPIAEWTPEKAIAFMDRHDIATQVLSLPFSFTTNPADSTDSQSPTVLVRQINEAMAEVIKDHPGRFGAFATLPFNTIDATLAEIDYALDVLKLDGVALTSNVGGRYFGQPTLEPILAELGRRRVPVFVHPTDCAYSSELNLGRVGSFIEFPFDTARNITNAALTGVFERHPGLTLILAHCGGALPTLAVRIAEHLGLGQGPADVAIDAQQFRDVLADLYYETALAGSPNSLLPTLEVTRTDHILFGTDFTAAPEGFITRNIEQLMSSKALDSADRHAIERGNAERLFPRFGAA